MRKLKYIISVVIAFLILGFYLANKVKTESSYAQAALKDALFGISSDWSYDSCTLFVAGDSEDEEYVSNKLDHYKKYGKIVICPYSPDNQMEISFFDRKPFARVYCDFENGSATVESTFDVYDGFAKLSTFKLISDL